MMKKNKFIQGVLNFSYGSNMSLGRLINRVSSAEVISFGFLERHKLKFHKKSIDGSGKCNAYFTDEPNDKIYGVIYSIKETDLNKLDRCEGRGSGYEKKDVIIKRINSDGIKAFTYCATDLEKGLKPYTWYKYHVLHGAVENSLPPDYISFIDSVHSKADPDKERVADELSIYSWKELE